MFESLGALAGYRNTREPAITNDTELVRTRQPLAAGILVGAVCMWKFYSDAITSAFVEWWDSVVKHKWGSLIWWLCTTGVALLVLWFAVGWEKMLEKLNVIVVPIISTIIVGVPVLVWKFLSIIHRRFDERDILARTTERELLARISSLDQQLAEEKTKSVSGMQEQTIQEIHTFLKEKDRIIELCRQSDDSLVAKRLRDDFRTLIKKVEDFAAIQIPAELTHVTKLRIDFENDARREPHLGDFVEKLLFFLQCKLDEWLKDIE